MRIAVEILPGIQAGVGRWQRETVKILAASVGIDIKSLIVFSYGNRYPRPEWMPANTAYNVSKLPGRLQWFCSEWLGIPVELTHALGNVDLILTMNLHTIKAISPVILAIADTSWRSFSSQYIKMFNSKQIQCAEKAIKLANKLVTISLSSAKSLIQSGEKQSRIHVAHLGVSEEFQGVDDYELNRVRHAYSLPEQFVLHIGGINERKNIKVLVDAMEKFNGILPLVLAGPIPSESLQYWGLDKPWVKHLGYIPEKDMPSLYAAAMVKVFPSLLEGFGLPLIEAMAVGTPVIAADIPVFHEIGGDAPLFFDPHDANELYKKIQIIQANKEFQKILSLKGLSIVKRLSWSAYKDDLIRIFKSTT